MLKEFINQYGLELMYAFITAIFGWLGVQIKKLYEKHINTKEKKDLVNTTVRYVEQVYKDLHGQDKLSQCLKDAAQLLQEKGLTFTDLELRALVEAAVNSMNKSLKEVEEDV